METVPVDKMTQSDSLLFKYVKNKIDECVEAERVASLQQDYEKADKVTQAYFRLLKKATEIISRYQ